MAINFLKEIQLTRVPLLRVLWITVISVLVSVLINFIVREVAGKVHSLDSFLIPALIPAVVAPLASIYLLHLLEKFQKIAEQNDQLKIKLNEHQEDLVIARLKAEHALDRLNDVASGGRVGLFRHNLLDDTWECNDIYRQFYGLPVSEFPEVTTALIDSRFDPKTKEAQLKERLDMRGEIEQKSHTRNLVLPDGTERQLITFVTSEYEKGQIVAMVGSAFDVTAERETQKQLTLANDQLTSLIERQRSLFAVIGHELRTPVASIEMLSNDADLSDTRKIELVKDISQGLLGVLEDLRTVIAPERVKEAQEVADYPSLVVKRALTPLAGLLQEKKIELHLELPSEQIECTFNAQALRQLVTNLVKNAAVHSGASHVWVKLTKVESIKGECQVELRIEDDGCGIPKPMVDKLFEAYSRGETEADGTGLGLFICSELAVALGGYIHFETSPMGGAAFVTLFSAKKASNVAVAESPLKGSSVISFEGKRILFAEDDKTLQMLTTKILEKAGAQVSVCNNGAEAMTAYADGAFDLVITDIMMPVMNGYQLVKALRKAGFVGPIIGATAAVVGSETDDLIASGADLTVPKPVSIDRLKSAFNQINACNAEGKVGTPLA